MFTTKVFIVPRGAHAPVLANPNLFQPFSAPHSAVSQSVRQASRLVCVARTRFLVGISKFSPSWLCYCFSCAAVCAYLFSCNAILCWLRPFVCCPLLLPVCAHPPSVPHPPHQMGDVCCVCVCVFVCAYTWIKTIFCSLSLSSSHSAKQVIHKSVAKGKAYGVGGCTLLQKEEVPTAPRPMQYFVPQ